jgi:hypothetical protein
MFFGMRVQNFDLGTLCKFAAVSARSLTRSSNQGGALVVTDLPSYYTLLPI